LGFFSFVPKKIGHSEKSQCLNFFDILGILILLNNYEHLINVEDSFHFCPKILGNLRIFLPNSVGQITKAPKTNSLPIIDQYPITKKISDLCHLCFILSDLKCYGNITSSSRIHLWNANEKEQWKKRISFPTYQMHFFFFFFSLDPSYFQSF